jgi:ATP-dependent DNA ligase
METLYQLDTNNNTKIWQIDVVNKGTFSEIVVRSGRLGGNLIENVSKVLDGKNAGKSNETTHHTQAISEMKSKIEQQLRKGYVRDLKDAKNSAILGSGVLSPMLAHKYCRDGSQSSSKTLTQLKLIGKKIFVQPKLDGNRCTIKIKDGVAQMFTRNGDLMPVQLKNIIDDVEAKAKEDCTLDGELYSDQISFNTLNGLIKREKASKEDIEKRKYIKFHLYDVMSSEGYKERFEYIEQFASDNIIIIDNYEIVATDDNIQEYLEKFLAAGNEGLMIRVQNVPYENKRSWFLLKCKVFEDDEFKLIGLEEDVRGGFVGAFVMQDKTGKQFNAGASGQSVDERTEMWLNQDKYIDRTATICYFGTSEYGIPRFPKFKGFVN